MHGPAGAILPAFFHFERVEWVPGSAGPEIRMLEMRENCERCNEGTGMGDTAYICSFECTFCEACAHEMNGRCPNCAGELLRRPRRQAMRDRD
jgi:hypothetical protein